MTAELAQHTYLPNDSDELAQVFDFLSAHQARHGSLPVPQYVLSGPGQHDRVEVPPEVHQVLLQVVAALRTGRAVTVTPKSTTLTTQQAADLLGVSRPTVIKLLDRGEIPFERIGERRRLQLRDVLDYRERRRKQQYDALDAMAIDIDDEGDAAQVIDNLKAARRAVAEARRARAVGQG